MRVIEDPCRPDYVLHQLLVTSVDQPELSGGDRRSDIGEKGSLFDALRSDVMQELADFRKNAVGIGRTHVRLERDPQLLHSLVTRRAKTGLDQHLRSDLDAEVGQLL